MANEECKEETEKTGKGIQHIIGKEIKTCETEIKKEILFNVPNSLTLLRLVLVFVFVYFLFMNYNKWIVFAIFLVAALTDWFDGYFARKLNQKTQIGARMDQVIDRVFTGIIVLSLFIYLIINNGGIENIFSFSSKNIALLLFLSISREILGLPGFIIALIRNKDPYKVRYIGKVTTFIQSVTLGAIILNLNFAILLAIATCICGILAGYDYLKYSLS